MGRSIHDPAGGSLKDDCDDAAEGESASDSARLPTERCQIGGHKWTKSGLHIGQEEVGPLERAETDAARFGLGR